MRLGGKDQGYLEVLEVYDELDDVITRFLMFPCLKIQG